MRLFHTTTVQRLAAIRQQGLLVSKTDPAAKIKGCWLHSKSNSPWSVVHTIRKHGATLEEVVVIEVNIPRNNLTRFRTGLWFTKSDIPATWLGTVTPGAAFGASASE